MMDLSFMPVTLEFKRPFKIAAGTRSTTPVVFTNITFHGLVGYGEASMPPYLGEDHQTVMSFLNKAKKVIAHHKDPFDIEGILLEVDQIGNGNTAAKASVDIALHDLVGKIVGKPWHALWNLDKTKTPYTTYTIGIDDADVIRQKVEEGASYKILKVKLDGVNDKEIISTIRSVTGKPIAVDVNQGWNDKEVALEMLHWLKERNVLFVEQPMPKGDVESMRWLTAHSPLPTIADESCQRLVDVEKMKGVFHGINIKLMKCTGMLEAYKMITLARKNNLKVLIGCMSETSCAVSAAAQLTPLADWADIDGPLLIKQDYFEGVRFEEGKIVLSESAGIGVKRREALFK